MVNYNAMDTLSKKTKCPHCGSTNTQFRFSPGSKNTHCNTCWADFSEEQAHDEEFIKDHLHKKRMM